MWSAAAVRCFIEFINKRLLWFHGSPWLNSMAKNQALMSLAAAPRNVAVVHEWLVDFAGSERVLEQILSVYPDATLYVLIDRMAPALRARFSSRRTVTSFLDRWPLIERYFTRCLPLMPFAVQQFDLSGHDLVISSSHCVAKGVIVPPDALHLCYCHSPMRYAWDLQSTYLVQEGLDRGLTGWLARYLFHRLRMWDSTSHHGVDHFAANSDFVRRRMLKCYRRSASVIHPPVDVDVEPLSTVVRDPRLCITVGRLLGYKNVALIVEAFRLLPDWKLTVAGEGPQRKALQAVAPPNVEFVGAVSETEKQRLLQSASAFVFAAVEDFGIAPAESLAAGTPVVALARGGVLDYLQHGQNAWLFADATPEALAQAVRAAFEHLPHDVADRCRRSVGGLSEACFRTNLSTWVGEKWSDWQRQQQQG
jgi:glycosyltransferase involved in cell wall biosynthesis